ncbi:Phosphate-selective porin O and P [Psychroflexus halocasei]|uniref:Phosphate-selective porin O and P n=2 Tax=Psychroflexus halocasei TaxID=908615 RepID=A0A1H3X6K1_9FLAO|nr:Phosphate-selective porin O and P [Psychroflexus halocasei]
MTVSNQTNMNFTLKVLSFCAALFIISFNSYSQSQDSTSRPLISFDKIKFLENIDMTFDMRMGMQAYTFRGGDKYYNGVQFKNEHTALGISAKVHEKVDLHFRNRFNKGSDVQTLDQLGSNIELAYINVKATDQLNILLGKMNTFYGGYEYQYSAMNILEYNDIYSRALAYVTGAGIRFQAFENHNFGLQILNSRTMHYDDLYGDIAAYNVEEPDWPVAVVGNWNGRFFDGKLQTNYSASYSNQVKSRGTYFFTVGHKYQSKKFSIMYDFEYSYEQIDTKGIMTDIIQNDNVAEDVRYIENWMRAEYQFNDKFKGLLTLMTSSAYGNFENEKDHTRTSYGVIPTLYFSPFKDIDIRFYIAYIGRYYDYTDYAKETFNVSNYNKNEARIGFIAPFKIL